MSEQSAAADWKPLILTATYVVVVFSIVVQGLTVARLATRVMGQQDQKAQ